MDLGLSDVFSRLRSRDGRLFGCHWAHPGSDSAVSAVRAIVNAAYRELGDRGWNYTAVDQDDAVTRRRMAQGRTIVVCDGQAPIGTVNLKEAAETPGPRCLYIGQFGFLPEYKQLGLGTRLMDLVERLAHEEGFARLQLDTAKPALHLVGLYLRRGYRIVAETRFVGKTYESWVFEKDARSSPEQAPEGSL